MGATTTVRRATEQDAEVVALLAGELGYPTIAEVMRTRLCQILPSANDLLVVAVDSSGKVVGWLQAQAAHLVESGFRVEIVGLIVSASVRRGGVGQLLVRAAEEWARSLSAKVIVVRSNVKRVESHLFYPKLGYTASKTQNVYRKALI